MSVPLIQTGGGGSSLATPVSLANGGTHADLSATGGANQVLKQSSVGANISVAALVQSDIPSILSTFGYLPNAAVKSSYIAFTAPANGSQCDIYTVPANKRAILMGYHISNAAGGASSTFQATVKISGTYQKISSITSPIAAAAGVSNVLTGGIFIAEAGDIFSLIQTTQTTFFVVATILEFDNTAPIKTVRLVSPVSGDQDFYTPSGSKNGLIVGNSILFTTVANVMAPWMYNATIAAISVKWNYRRGATAASTSNIITGAASCSAGVAAQASQLALITIANGDTLSVNLTATNPGGMLFLNVLEF